MIVADVAWWRLAVRMSSRRLWKVLISVFIGGQAAALVSAMAGLDWPRLVPKAVLMTVMVWHYVALAVFLPLGAVWACGWMIRNLRARQEHNASSARSTFRTGEPPRESKLISQNTVTPREDACPPEPDDCCEPGTDCASNSLTRREFLGAAAALAPPLFTVGLASVAVAQLSNLRVRRFTLAMPALPRALDGLTIAHVTDMHVGRLTCGGVLRQIVDKTNALRADLVLMTGDFIDYALSDLPDAIAAAKRMESRYGLWMVEGNHDLADDAGEFQRTVRAAGLRLLLDTSAVTEVRGYPVQIFGLRWMLGLARALGGRADRVMAAQLRLTLRQRQPDAFPILLAHHPHAFDAAVAADLPLTLAGHTHGGQLMLDRNHGLGPMMFRYWSGHYTRGRSHLIVCNGAGTWLPLRFNAPAEIIHLTLRCVQ